MVTWNNTLVYSCECVCLFSFTLLSCECIFLCLVLSDVNWHVPHSDAIYAESGSVESI